MFDAQNWQCSSTVAALVCIVKLAKKSAAEFLSLAELNTQSTQSLSDSTELLANERSAALRAENLSSFSFTALRSIAFADGFFSSAKLETRAASTSDLVIPELKRSQASVTRTNFGK